jgi:hypothetical protein
MMTFEQIRDLTTTLAVKLTDGKLYLYSSNSGFGVITYKLFVTENAKRWPQEVCFQISVIEKNIMMYLDDDLAKNGWIVPAEISQWLQMVTTNLKYL